MHELFSTHKYGWISNKGKTINIWYCPKRNNVRLIAEINKTRLKNKPEILSYIANNFIGKDADYSSLPFAAMIAEQLTLRSI